MQNPIVPFVLDLLSTLTLIGDIVIVGLVVLLGTILVNKKARKTRMVRLISDNYVALAFIIASIATIGSLFFSEIAHFTPCKYCWWQRIFMYPQMVILGTALFTNDNKVIKYSLPLTILGIYFAVRHILIQQFPLRFNCTDEVANCAFAEFTHYGYITIPVMSLTAFLLIFLLLLIRGRKA